MESENTNIERQDGENVLCEDITQLLVQRRYMYELSEYFGRDARRYDNGFETY